MVKKMDKYLYDILNQFKCLLEKKLSVHKVILFGSRARGDAIEESDVDIIVILDEEVSDVQRDYISDCSWEIGFHNHLVLSPVVFTLQEWEHGPERISLLGLSVRAEGVAI